MLCVWQATLHGCANDEESRGQKTDVESNTTINNNRGHKYRLRLGGLED